MKRQSNKSIDERHGSKSGNNICSKASMVSWPFRQGYWRKAQKARKSRRISQYHPPPPAKTVGGGGRISREICRFFPFMAVLWRRGSPGWTATGLVVILNHAEILNNPCPFKRPNHGTLESLVSR